MCKDKLPIHYYHRTRKVLPNDSTTTGDCPFCLAGLHAKKITYIGNNRIVHFNHYVDEDKECITES